MFYVYILRSKSLQCNYVGCTQNLKDRVKQHKAGQSTYTSKASDWKLIYYEAFMSKTDALVEEKFLKSGKGKERIKYLLKNTIGGVA